MTAFRFWDHAAVRARLDELMDRIRAEEANLSGFRRGEAFYLVLSDDEQAEFLCLDMIDAHLHREADRKRKIAQLLAGA